MFGVVPYALGMDKSSITLLVVVGFLLFIGGAFRTPRAAVKTLFLVTVGYCILEAGSLANAGRNLDAIFWFAAPWIIAFAAIRLFPVSLYRSWFSH